MSIPAAEGFFRREVWLVIIAASLSLLLGIGSSYVTSYARMAMLEQDRKAVWMRFDDNRDDRLAIRAEVALAALVAKEDRDRIRHTIDKVAEQMARIDRLLARIEAKME